MAERINKFLYSSIIISILLFVLGMIFMIFPEVSFETITYILSVVLIINPHIIDITENINIDSQLLYPYFFNNKDILKSKADLVTITIPTNIGNNVFINTGFSINTTPINIWIIPSVKNPEKKKLDSFSTIK